MDHDEPRIATPPPSMTELLGEVVRGVIPASHLQQMKAVVETVPGPGRDWRALLVTETLSLANEALSLLPSESVVIVSENTSSSERRRYERKGWTALSMDSILKDALGEQTFRRCLQHSTPKMRQAAMIEYLQEIKADRRLQWPALKILDSFYRSADSEPSSEHLARVTDRDMSALEIAKTFWGRQLENPLASRLGMPREAMSKLWQHEGGRWPSQAPYLPPKVIAVASAEELAAGDIQALAKMPCAVVYFGDPAIGTTDATPDTLNTHPLGSETLSASQATRLSLGDGLPRAIQHRQQNDVEMDDRWLQTSAALSATTLGYHRQDFDAFRECLGRRVEDERSPPLAPAGDAPDVVLSRHGAHALRQQLNALRGEGPPTLIEGSGDWKNYLNQAHDVATVILKKQEDWPDKLQKRYKKGPDAALFSWSHSAEKRALISLINQQRSPQLIGQLETLQAVPFRQMRIVKPNTLETPEKGAGLEGILRVQKGDIDATLSAHRPTIAINDDAEEGARPSIRGHYLYRQLSRFPLQVTQDGGGTGSTLDFLLKACQWLDVQHARHRELRESATPSKPSSPPEVDGRDVLADAIEDHAVSADIEEAYWADSELPHENADQTRDTEPQDEHDTSAAAVSHPAAGPFEGAGAVDDPAPADAATQTHETGSIPSGAPSLHSTGQPAQHQAHEPFYAYSDDMLIDAAAHEAQMLAEERGDYGSPDDAYYYADAPSSPAPEPLAHSDDAIAQPKATVHERQPEASLESPDLSHSSRWRSFKNELRERQASPPSSGHPYKKTQSPGM